MSPPLLSTAPCPVRYLILYPHHATDQLQQHWRCPTARRSRGSYHLCPTAVADTADFLAATLAADPPALMLALAKYSRGSVQR